VATVDEKGVVIFVGSGYVTITATAADRGTITASIELECLPESTFTLPASLTAIEEEAFVGLPVQCVIIPDGTTSIGVQAFADCEALYKMIIPDSVTEIADDAFEGSDQVTICAPEGSYAQLYAEEHSFGFKAAEP